MRTEQNRITIIFSFVILLIFCLLFYLFNYPEKTISILENNEKGVFNLFAHWEKGNIVAIIRHTERCDRSDNQCLEGQNGITVVGKEMAIELGKNFKKTLSTDNAIIYNSPIKRTKQTANFMFNGISREKTWLREGCKKNLYGDIFNYKEEGKNLILVTHSTCMDYLGKLEGDKLIEMDIHNKKAYGIIIFIALDKIKKQAYVLGYLYPKSWKSLLKKS